MDPVERVDAGVRDRLPPGEQFLADGLAVDGVNQRPAHPDIPEDQVVEIEVDVLVDQARLVDDVEFAAVALLKSDGLVDGQPQLAGDHVDVAG